MAKPKPAGPPNPFSLSPDPTFLYLTEGLRETIAKVDWTIDMRQGLTIVYGDVGMGKSTLMRFIGGQYNAREDLVVASLLKPKYNTDLQLLKAICGEFRVTHRHARLAQEAEFNGFLIESYQAGKNVVLLVDEAQMLKGQVLELIRTLNNYETDDAKLIQIVLFAQLELRDSLRDVSKRAIESRVFVYSMLDPLSPAETANVINYRLERFRAGMTFTSDAIERIYALTNGVPRQVMKLAEVTYMFAMGNQVSAVEPDLVDHSYRHVSTP